MPFTESILKDFVGIVVALATIVFVFFKWRFQYWKKRGFPFVEPQIPFGNLENSLRRKTHITDIVNATYNLMKLKGCKHVGLFFTTRPAYLVVDLDYVKNVLTKDFQYFTDRGVYYNEKDDPLSAHLFAIGGPKWRNLRTKLTPTFTSGKMRAMFHTLVDCAPFLLEKVRSDVEQGEAIDIKEVLGCFTTDIIGSCAFGLECNTFQDKDTPFRKYGKKIFEGNKITNLKTDFVMNAPSIARAMRIKLVPDDVSRFFMKVVSDTVSYRETNNFARKDFMQLLIDLKNNKLAVDEGFKHDGKTLTLDEIAAQCFVFFLAGFETSSTTMTFALYELSKNQELQQKVRDEITAVLAKHEDKITYDSMQELKYMDQVINETLRKYPPVPFITRECVKDYKIPDQDLILEKGTRTIIPIMAIHYDKYIYPDPERFDPDRFSEENSASRHHYAHIPFGEGPRLCIGMRFGLMQSKVGLTALLKNYKFTVSEKTQEPLTMKSTSFVLAANGEVWLDAHKL